MVHTDPLDLAKMLLQIKAIKLNPQNPFTWASGIKSPIYCDNRVTLSHPTVRTKVKESLARLAGEFEGVEVIAGVATAGIAHGALLADFLGLPFIYVRAEAKSHGRQNQIEGELSPDQRVLVVEDLISTGGSSLQVVEVLRQNQAIVVGTVALFDYGFEDARKNFEEKNCLFKTITNYEVLLSVALEEGYIAAEEVAVLQAWRKNPKAWP